MSGNRKRNHRMSRWLEEVCCSLELVEGTRSGNLSTRVRNTPFVQPKPSWNISAVDNKIRNKVTAGSCVFPYFHIACLNISLQRKKRKNLLQIINQKHLFTPRIKCFVKILLFCHKLTTIAKHLVHTAWNALKTKPANISKNVSYIDFWPAMTICLCGW